MNMNDVAKEVSKSMVKELRQRARKALRECGE